MFLLRQEQHHRKKHFLLSLLTSLLHGYAAIPGLVNSHVHVLSGGLFSLKCDLNYQPLDIEATLKHV